MPVVTDTGFLEMRLGKVVAIGSADGHISFAAGLLHALGGRIRQVRIDRLMPVPVGGTAYCATVEVENAAGVASVDARPSDALNLVALVPAPILVARDVLAQAEAERQGDSAEAILLRRALEADQMTVGRELTDR